MIFIVHYFFVYMFSISSFDIKNNDIFTCSLLPVPRSKGDGSNLTDTGQTNLRLAQAGGELSILYIIFILFGIIFFGIILSVVVAFYNRKRKKGYGKPMAPVHSTEVGTCM